MVLVHDYMFIYVFLPHDLESLMLNTIMMTMITIKWTL